MVKLRGILRRPFGVQTPEEKRLESIQKKAFDKEISIAREKFVKEMAKQKAEEERKAIADAQRRGREQARKQFEKDHAKPLAERLKEFKQQGGIKGKKKKFRSEIKKFRREIRDVVG